MLEVDCSILTPEPVLKASGHVDRFADLMAKDVKTGECFRLDHLIKSALEKIAADKKTAQNVRDEIADIVVKVCSTNMYFSINELFPLINFCLFLKFESRTIFLLV